MKREDDLESKIEGLGEMSMENLMHPVRETPSHWEMVESEKVKDYFGSKIKEMGKRQMKNLKHLLRENPSHWEVISDLLSFDGEKELFTEGRIGAHHDGSRRIRVEVDARVTGLFQGIALKHENPKKFYRLLNFFEEYKWAFLYAPSGLHESGDQPAPVDYGHYHIKNFESEKHEGDLQKKVDHFNSKVKEFKEIKAGILGTNKDYRVIPGPKTYVGTFDPFILERFKGFPIEKLSRKVLHSYSHEIPHFGPKDILEDLDNEEIDSIMSLRQNDLYKIFFTDFGEMLKGGRKNIIVLKKRSLIKKLLLPRCLLLKTY